MNPLFENLIFCPYCGEGIKVLIDVSEVGQEYIEDCQVCCRPIVFSVEPGASGKPLVSVRTDDETF